MKIPREPARPSRTVSVNSYYKSAKIISINHFNELSGNQGILKSAIVPQAPVLFNK
jgi:hypothetical protein